MVLWDTAEALWVSGNDDPETMLEPRVFMMNALLEVMLLYKRRSLYEPFVGVILLVLARKSCDVFVFTLCYFLAKFVR